MAQAGAGATKFRILLVEEDPEMARLILAVMAQAGLQCQHARDAQAGFEAFQKNDPHLLLLSLGLPRIGGAVLCPKIREVSTVPIIIISVRTRREDHLHALNIGADDFLVMRPADEQVLMARVLSLLRRVYRYDRVEAEEALDTQAIQSTQSKVPQGWVTCEMCSYMGPWNRFERLDATGNRAMICPHCNQAQSLKFNVA